MNWKINAYLFDQEITFSSHLASLPGISRLFTDGSYLIMTTPRIVIMLGDSPFRYHGGITPLIKFKNGLIPEQYIVTIRFYFTNELPCVLRNSGCFRTSSISDGHLWTRANLRLCKVFNLLSGKFGLTLNVIKKWTSCLILYWLWSAWNTFSPIWFHCKSKNLTRLSRPLDSH